MSKDVEVLPKKEKPCICFAGPLLGKNPGVVTSPAETLAPFLEDRGYKIILTSSIKNRYIRPFDIVQTLIRYHSKIDILCLQVYAHRSFIVEDIVSWLGDKFRHHIIMVLHGGTIPDFISNHPYWIKKVFNRANLIVVPSGYLVNTLALYGFSVRIIPNAIDISKYQFFQRHIVGPKLLWMRTFYDEYYNPQMAVYVLKKLKKIYPNASLTMAGQDKGSLRYIKSLVKELGLEDSVRFPGFLDDSVKPKEFLQHDIFINTNKVDHMPTTLLEAAAFGTPIVATDVGGIPFIFTNEETALLIPSNDVDAMVGAIIRLIDNPNLANSLSGNARRLAEKFDFSFTIPLWEEAFKDVLNK